MNDKADEEEFNKLSEEEKAKALRRLISSKRPKTLRPRISVNAVHPRTKGVLIGGIPHMRFSFYISPEAYHRIKDLREEKQKKLRRLVKYEELILKLFDIYFRRRALQEAKWHAAKDLNMREGSDSYGQDDDDKPTDEKI